MVTIRVTPELADHLLRQCNRNNRHISRHRVRQYADDMERGDWRLNGDSIRISKSGKLLDGQHRLHAIRESAQTIKMVFALGLDDETQVTMDTGKPRSAADVLAVEGMDPWTSRVASTAVYMLLNYGHGLPMTSTVRATNLAVRNFFLESPQFLDSVYFVAELPRRHPVIEHSKAMALHYLFAQRDRVLADWFMRTLFDGANLGHTDVLYHLRQRLIETRLSGTPLRSIEVVYALLVAWRIVRQRRRCSSFRAMRMIDGQPLPEVA